MVNLNLVKKWVIKIVYKKIVMKMSNHLDKIKKLGIKINSTIYSKFLIKILKNMELMVDNNINRNENF